MSNETSIYVAASSADIDRAERWIRALRDAGHRVTSTWPEVIRAQPGAVSNPRDATDAARCTWSVDDMRQIFEADVLWFLAPPADMPTRGAWIEFGYAYARGRSIVSSGDTKQSIFCALGVELASDADAFAWICRASVAPAPGYCCVHAQWHGTDGEGCR